MTTGWAYPSLTDARGDAELRRHLNTRLRDLERALAGKQSSLGWINIKDYGARCNGLTNDSAAVDAALAALSTAGGGVLFHPGGDCVLGSTATVPANVHVLGAGPTESLFSVGTTDMGGSGANPGAMFTVATSAVTFEGVGLVGSGTSAPGERGIDVSAGSCRVLRCRFTDLVSGVRFSGTSATDGVVTLCTFQDIVGDAGESEGYGVQTSGLRTRIIDNVFLDIERHAIYFAATACDGMAAFNVIRNVNSSHAIQVYATTAQAGANDNLIAYNRITGTLGGGGNSAGIVISTNARRNRVIGNQMDGMTGSGGYGIIVSSDASTPDATYRCLLNAVIGNHVDTSGSSADAIAILNADDTVVLGNRIVGNTSAYGVHCYTSGTGDPNTRRSRVAHNDIRGCLRPIRINGASVSATMIGQNFFYNNTSDVVQDTGTSTTYGTVDGMTGGTIAGDLTSTGIVTGAQVVASPGATYGFTDYMRVYDGTLTGTWGFSSATGAICWRSGASGYGFAWYDGASNLLGRIDGTADLADFAGGFAHTLDGWYYDNVGTGLAEVEMTRAAGRWTAVRAGSVLGVVVKSTEARTAGTATVTVYKNTGLAGAAGSSIGLTAVLDGTNTSTKATTQAKDTDTFAAGDELYVTVQTDGSWTPTTADLRASLLVEC